MEENAEGGSDSGLTDHWEGRNGLGHGGIEVRGVCLVWLATPSRGGTGDSLFRGILSIPP